MTEPDRKFEEDLRRALCAASDLVVPAGDGLNKIRERTARQSPILGWLLAYVVYLPRQLVRAGRVAASEVAATAHGSSSLGLVVASARRWPGGARQLLRTPGIWLRPALASATALLLVIAVTLSIPRLRQQVTAQLDSAFGSSSGQNSGGGSHGRGPAGGAQSDSATPIGNGTPTYMAGKPWLATMPASSDQCRDQGSAGARTVRHVSGTSSSQPRPSQTATAGTGTNAMPKSAGLARLSEVGPVPVSVTCPSSSAPANRATSQQVTPPSTTPVTTPAVAASTSPVTSPTTTPVTSPTTTPATSPATTPATSPTVTTSPTDTSTSSSDSTASTGDAGGTGAGTGTGTTGG